MTLYFDMKLAQTISSIVALSFSYYLYQNVTLDDEYGQSVRVCLYNPAEPHFDTTYITPPDEILSTMPE